MRSVRIYADGDVIIDIDDNVYSVKHGYWLINEKNHSIECSECGSIEFASRIDNGNNKDKPYKPWQQYCSMCGAKMDKNSK